MPTLNYFQAVFVLYSSCVVLTLNYFQAVIKIVSLYASFLRDKTFYENISSKLKYILSKSKNPRLLITVTI